MRKEEKNDETWFTFLRELASVKSLVSPALFVTCGPFAHEYFVMLSAPPNTPFSKKKLVWQHQYWSWNNNNNNNNLNSKSNYSFCQCGSWLEEDYIYIYI
jgi:hypothetical protein